MSTTSRWFWLVLALVILGPTSLLPAQVLGTGLPSRTLLDRYGLEHAWANQATINVRNDVVKYLIADEQVVIVQTRAGMLTVFDAESGRRLWNGLLAVANQYSYPAVTNSDNLYVIIGSRLYARDKYNGDELWTLRLPNSPSTPPAVDEQRVYAGLITGDVYAYNLDKLADLQARGMLRTWRREARAWHLASSSQIVGPPVTNGRFVAFTNGMGVLYVFSTDSRELKFAFETEEPVSAPLALGVGTEAGVRMTYIYYPAGNNNFYCIRSTNGTTKWTYVSAAPIQTKPTIIKNDIFITPVASGMYNIDSANGNVRWWTPVIEQFVAASPTRIYGTDSAGNLAIVGRNDGGLIGTIPMQDFPIRVRNERTDRIFVCSTSGRVACFKEEKIKQPLFHAHPERRPILPIFPGDEVIPAPGAEPPQAPVAPEGEELPAGEAVPEMPPVDEAAG